MGVEDWKISAAEAAARLVKRGMTVGLGSGSTVAHAVKCLAKLKLDAPFVPSSIATQRLASELGLKLASLHEYRKLDLMIDGADEVDARFNMIKGRGGAQTREKIVADAAKRVVIVVDRTKLVSLLGEKMPVPVEVLPFVYRTAIRRLAELGGKPVLRATPTGAPFVTDDGNYIVDVKFRSISNPAKLEQVINRVPGVIENGIFVGVADIVLVGYEGGCKILKSKKDFVNFARALKKT
ncbi:MAG: ribose 5-phosphate isomerase A [Hadesarchaea archaeon CG08_land_8_20_14_0_20_51_8]|nr:MAG: ribose 5-phosphate isomerase A [Hadesarchaea archaeon CG08_land_8_20_14_0_20_51_8]